MSEKPLKETDEPTLDSEKTEVTPVDETPKETPTKSPSKLKRFFKGYWRKKLWTLPLTLLVILGVLLAIPTTRYLLVGWFWQENITITVRDSQNNSLVTQANVTIDGKTVVTNKEGQAKVAAVHVGNRHAEVEKKYYSTLGIDLEVPVLANNKNFDLTLKATGRLTKVKVTNKISGVLVADALLDAGNGNQAKTDKDGLATLVIPVDKKEISVAVRSSGFNDATLTVQPDKEGSVALIPSGKMFFLSKQSGKIDVVKTNYDGSDREVILAGTGNEEDSSTSLLASRDWKYLVLNSKRESGKNNAIYLINTSTGGTTVIDQGDANFNLVGWSDHQIVYSLSRNNIIYTDAKRSALKSFNADSQKISVIDENRSEDVAGGKAYEELGNLYIIDNTLTYTKVWNMSSPYARQYTAGGRQNVIISARSDGANKKTIRSAPVYAYSGFNARLYEPQEIYFAVFKVSGEAPEYFEYEDGTLKPIENGEAAFAKAYPTFLVSPNGQEVFWAESRDGKNALFLGGKNAENEQKLTLQSNFTPYGWMTDQYLLLQKDDSELYITTKDQIKNGSEPVKISDYHKARVNYDGYGAGYGGQ
jgi:hypothetical protein